MHILQKFGTGKISKLLCVAFLTGIHVGAALEVYIILGNSTSFEPVEK